LLGLSKIESTVRYLGIEVDDMLEIAEKIDIRSLDATPQSADMAGDVQFVRRSHRSPEVRCVRPTGSRPTAQQSLQTCGIATFRCRNLVAMVALFIRKRTPSTAAIGLGIFRELANCAV
jgi:hypothetical protein